MIPDTLFLFSHFSIVELAVLPSQSLCDDGNALGDSFWPGWRSFARPTSGGRNAELSLFDWWHSGARKELSLSWISWIWKLLLHTSAKNSPITRMHKELSLAGRVKYFDRFNNWWLSVFLDILLLWRSAGDDKIIHGLPLTQYVLECYVSTFTEKRRDTPLTIKTEKRTWILTW